MDASGKDTQASRLCTNLRNSGRSVLLRTHPSADNPLGVKARDFLYLEGKGAHLAAALFYMLDVIHSVLRYSWRRYDRIIFVRYLMGTAYLPPPLHKFAYYFFAKTLPTSNLMFFLDVTPSEAFRRIQASRKSRERFETLEELEKTRRKALALAVADKWIILNADRSEKAIEGEIKAFVLGSHTCNMAR